MLILSLEGVLCAAVSNILSTFIDENLSSQSIQSLSFMNITVQTEWKTALSSCIILVCQLANFRLASFTQTNKIISSQRAALPARNWTHSNSNYVPLGCCQWECLTWHVSYPGSLLIWQNDTSGKSNTRPEWLPTRWLKEEMKSGCRMINTTALFSVFPFWSLFAQLRAVTVY